MGKIFYLMGKSSSGKDTLYKLLMAEESLALKQIVQYTTRPIRSGEEEGTEYYFVTADELDRLKSDGKIIESRSYDTCYGVWTYATVYDDKIDLIQNNYLMIGTLDSFKKVQAYFGKDAVLPIMIECDDGVRLQRALDREMAQKEPKYEEMCRRYLADASDFSIEKQQSAGIDRVFYNDTLDKCCAEIKQYILQNMH